MKPVLLVTGPSGLTPAQQEAVGARGNVLVVAGAGTGKTRTLVERCLHLLLHERPPVSMDEILMVTFTEAAAAEMRQRIRVRLEEQARSNPSDARWSEQLALFERAQIGTLHSFCLRLIREHFYELELDPQFSVLTEEDARLLADETLEDQLNDYYGAEVGLGRRFQAVVQEQGRGTDKHLRALILQLHRYSQSLPEGVEWLAAQIKLFSSDSPPYWSDWLESAVHEWKERWLPVLGLAASENQLAAGCIHAFHRLGTHFDRADAAQIAAEVLETFENCPRGKKGTWSDPFKHLQREGEFLRSLLVRQDENDPLLQDWHWVREHTRTVLEAAVEFTRRFANAKREMGVADFQDLEQHALKMLWDTNLDQPSVVARHWRERLRFIFVDEYQDINAVQDRIITALSREGGEANRFLVGDVKQSIYRFRLANPRIFQAYAETWQNPHGQAIPLRENFRSHAGILHFVNSLLSLLMRRETGGIAYDERASLVPGDPSAPKHASGVGLPVEIHFRVKETGEQNNNENENGEQTLDLRDLAEAEKDARMIALRLRQLRESKYPVWDEAARAFRPVEWKDMAILLRSPSGKSESYAKEFTAADVPLLVERGGYYDSLEVTDLLSVMQILDNPLQDIPLLAVLRSPIAGLSAAELATIRMVTPRGRYWTALVRWHREEMAKNKSRNNGNTVPETQEKDGGDGSALLRKVDAFMIRYARWRRLARQASLCRCLEVILAETHYSSWVLTQPRGPQRHANVRRLLGLAQHFDQFQKQGLFRFLRFIEAQRAVQSEPSVPAVTDQNAVRLMSIHQSKGLEFPVVVVADVSKPFNLRDVHSEVILDEQYGLCSQVRPPQTGATYPSLPYWLANHRQRRELVGEEIRLLYVAITRARDLLVLAAGLSPAKHRQLFEAPPSLHPMNLLRANSYADWIAAWFAHNRVETEGQADQGQNEFVRWFVKYDSSLAKEGLPEAAREDNRKSSVLDENAWRAVQAKLAAPYDYEAATNQPAKMSATALRRLASSEDEEAAAILPPGSVVAALSAGLSPQQLRNSPKNRETKSRHQPDGAGKRSARSRLTASEIGNAHHTFLQQVALDRIETTEALESEAARLHAKGALSKEEASALDFPALCRFWNSSVGRAIRDNAACVQRELPFTCRISAHEIARLTGRQPSPGLENDFVVVQGVADLVVVRPRELWIVDFKTDDITTAETAKKAEFYRVQLLIYARALSRIYSRAVTRCWLCFLTPGQAVEMPMSDAPVPLQMLMAFE